MSGALERSDKQASEFEALFKEYYAFVFRLAFTLVGSSSEAEDITQEVFIAVLRSLARFKGEAKISTWIYRITMRIAGRYIGKRKQTSEMNNEDNDPSEQCSSVGLSISDFNRALEKLTLPQRTLLSLIVIEGLSHKEVAEILGIPAGTVGSRLHRARQELSRHIGR